MSRLQAYALALLALASPGCTLLINGNQYVGSGVDGGPGADMGPGRDSSVDVGPHVNSPPVFTTVGLDNYRPMVGEVVHALAGRVYDADGDTTTVSYQWYVNGAMVAGQTMAALSTSTLTAGDRIHVEAWADDGMSSSAHVTTSDVAVLTSATRWRQLLPNEDNGLPQLVWDAPHHRAVRIADGGVWEYAVENTAMRISLLPTAGTPPPSDDSTIVLFDEGRRRLIVSAAMDPTNLYVLDISHRGGGTWQHTPTTGSTPPSFFLTSSFYDPGTHRIYVLGGKDDTLGALYGLTALDVSSAGAESWQTIVPSGATLPSLFGATIAPDPTIAGRYYLIGGMTSTVGSTAVDAVYSALPHVLQIDVTATDFHVTPLSGAEPPVFGASSALEPTTGHIVVYGGFTSFGTAPSIASPQVFDPSTGTFTALPGPTPHAAVFGAMAANPTQPGHLDAFTVGIALSATEATSALQYDDVTESSVTQVVAHRGPQVIEDAAARFNEMRVELVGGRNGSGAASTNWSLDLRTLAWSPLVATADPATTHMPQTRYGVISDTTPFGTQTALFQMTGAHASDLLTDTAAFELDVSNQWIEHTATGTPPQPRVGAVVTASTCGSTRAFVYGGETVTGTPFGDAMTLTCTNPHLCSWSAPGAIDAGRSYAAVYTVGGIAIVFGGRDATGPLNDVLAMSTCPSGAPTAMPVTASGPPPTGRFGHSMTSMTGASASVQFGVVFGGTDGTLSFSDLHTLTFDGGSNTVTWGDVTPAGFELPRPRAYHVAVPDLVGRRIIVAGGLAYTTFGSSNTNDVWELVFRP